MKTVLWSAVALVIFAQAASAEILVKATRTPGYEIDPESSVLTIDSSGEVKLVVHNFRSNRDRTVKVAALSRHSVNRIMADINALPANDPLIDEQAGQPLCTDMDSYSTRVMKDGREIEVSRSASCHQFRLASNGASLVRELARVFLKF